MIACFCNRLYFDFFLPFLQDKFSEAPVVLVTSEHLKTGKEYDAALIWTEDVTKDSLKVCLREMQNFDGRHEDISVVCTYCEDCVWNFCLYSIIKNTRDMITG